MYRNLASIRLPIGTIVKRPSDPALWKVVGLLGKTSDFDCQIETTTTHTNGTVVTTYSSAKWFDLVAA